MVVCAVFIRGSQVIKAAVAPYTKLSGVLVVPVPV
jgi:hypothetical protein